MYKIKYLVTGNIFCLPEEIAIELKQNFPQDYLILEKNGKIFKDKASKNKQKTVSSGILNEVLDK